MKSSGVAQHKLEEDRVRVARCLICWIEEARREAVYIALVQELRGRIDGDESRGVLGRRSQTREKRSATTFL